MLIYKLIKEMIETCITILLILLVVIYAYLHANQNVLFIVMSMLP